MAYFDSNDLNKNYKIIEIICSIQWSVSYHALC